MTSCMSSMRSNQLSYAPVLAATCATNAIIAHPMTKCKPFFHFFQKKFNKERASRVCAPARLQNVNILFFEKPRKTVQFVVKLW